MGHDLVAELCRQATGADAARVLFSGTSVGEVAAVELTDGRVVVVKIHQPRWTAPFLAAVVEVHAAIAATGVVPCPVPVAGPLPAGDRWATIETYLPDPGQAPIVPAMLEVSAAGLAALVTAARGIDGDGLRRHPLRTPEGALYPEPHSPVFDFEAAAAGAEWIDELAAAAMAVRRRDPSPPTVSHGDWSARNVRLGSTRVRAAYDWDSLLFEPESVAVGIAACTWSALGVSHEPMAPSAEEVGRYLAAYETARGRPLTPAQRAAARASALYGLAYTARCEHALDRGGDVHVRARARLRAEGAALLEPPP